MTEETNTILLTTALSLKAQEFLIIFCALVAIGFGAYNVKSILDVKMEKQSTQQYRDLEMDELKEMGSANADSGERGQDTAKVLNEMAYVSELIQ